MSVMLSATGKQKEMWKKHIHRRRGQWKILEDCIKIIFLFFLPRKNTYNKKPGYIHIITWGHGGCHCSWAFSEEPPAAQDGEAVSCFCNRGLKATMHSLSLSFELFLLSIMPRFFSVANPPGFLLLGWVSHLLTWLLLSLLHNNLPRSGQLFWSPVPVLHSSFFIFLWLFLYFFFLLHIFTPTSSSFPYPFICSCLTAFLCLSFHFIPFCQILSFLVLSLLQNSSTLWILISY